MDSLQIIPIVCICMVLYLSGIDLQFRGLRNSAYNLEKNLILIEFLTQHKSKTKDYSRSPEEYGQYQHFIQGTMEGNCVSFLYEYPLIHKIQGRLQINLEPLETSRQVDTFGLPQAIVEIRPEGFRIASGVSQATIDIELNRNGWGENGIAYSELIPQFDSLTVKIASNLIDQLSSNSQDNYLNRVQAALNFVQFIPYGQPDFNTTEWYYHGLSLPPESFVLGYADCDSKALFFASILSHLIPKENIIVVHCTVKSSQSRTNGAHAMAAVSDLGVVGETLQYNNKSYLLLETTAPSAIGSFDWISFEVREIRPIL